MPLFDIGSICLEGTPVNIFAVSNLDNVDDKPVILSRIDDTIGTLSYTIPVVSR